jgi:hypothetical protein
VQGSSLPEGLDKSITAWEVQIQKLESSLYGPYSPYGCDKGCSNFYLACTRKVNLDQADALNGVTERWFIGIQYTAYNTVQKKFHEAGKLVIFENTNSGWKATREYDSYLYNKNSCSIIQI